jgi:hypothetical protein
MRSLCKAALFCAGLVGWITMSVYAGDGNSAEQKDPVTVQPKKAPAQCSELLAEDFVPMTLSERFAYMERSMFGPKAFVFTALRAGINQWKDEPPEWGQGAAGYGRRYGSAYAQSFIRETLMHGSAMALHEDNRYFASGEQGFGRRLRYVIASAFLARHDDGSRHISISAIGSRAGAAFISRAWQPSSTNTAGDAAVSFGLGMAAHIGFNAMHEFLPRLSRVLP